MLLVAGLSGAQAKEMKIAADAKADAGLVLREGLSNKSIKHLIEAAGDVPLGASVKGMSEDETNELVSLGCDFLVFDIKAPSAVVRNEEAGRILMIEPSLDLGLARAINGLGVDGVLLNVGGGSPFVTVEHLLVCRRFVDLLETPVMMALPALVTMAELTGIWQAGVDGVVAPPSPAAEALPELRAMIGDLPKGARGRRARVDVRLPHYGGGGADEEDEEAEEDEDI
jgi:hypothetical protein